jgi:hypothetical protein
MAEPRIWGGVLTHTPPNTGTPNEPQIAGVSPGQAEI